MNLCSLTDKYCKKYGNFTPNVVFETADASALRYMLEKNEGLFIVPEKFFMLQPSYKVTLLRSVPENMGWLSTLQANTAVSIMNKNTYCRGGSNRSNRDSLNEIETDLQKPVTN